MFHFTPVGKFGTKVVDRRTATLPGINSKPGIALINSNLVSYICTKCMNWKTLHFMLNSLYVKIL